MNRHEYAEGKKLPQVICPNQFWVKKAYTKESIFIVDYLGDNVFQYITFEKKSKNWVCSNDGYHEVDADDIRQRFELMDIQEISVKKRKKR